MKLKFSASAALAAMLLILASCFPSRANAQVGQIAQAQGSVELARTGLTRAIGLGTALYLNDEVIDGPAASSTINLNGGSSLELGESTTLKIDQHIMPANQGHFTSRLTLALGTVRSVVPALSGGGTEFEVHTPNAVTSVRGTVFRVTFSAGQARFGYPGCSTFTDVDVELGVVAVANRINPSLVVNVPEGYSATVACDRAPEGPSPLGIGRSTSGGVSGPGAVAPPPPPAAVPVVVPPPNPG
ncbi:MAG TPA: FecR domain-containing protein [Candidatus Binataceae bacterium]|nr:FecR domain-containing protein [Candidatus Binataceae bacterium]